MTSSKQETCPKLILGTANYGNKKYGLNKIKISSIEATKLINFSIKNKIIFFDTAHSYNSEKN